MMRRTSLVFLCATAAVSCNRSEPSGSPGVVAAPAAAPAKTYGRGYEAEFVDDAKSNTKVDADKLDLTFRDSAGAAVDLKKYRGHKNVVLVFMRGFPGYICPGCSTQTSHLIRSYDEFAKRDAEVLVVFPGRKDR